MDTTATNIELLYDKAKKYTETSMELFRLNAIDKTADVASSLMARMAIVMVVAMFTLFVNIGIALFIGKMMGEYYLGFMIVSLFYLILAVVLHVFRNQFIKIPITNLVIEKLMKTKMNHQPNETEADENV
ncbi:hypothetical protein [Flavobacterium sp.]|uniref:hypothetical protein n=1 Tax=Flavobacterium sp. TaxID=239 RepID=UPI002B4B4A22|nr:hypothetical protein [Flavobacterium sp.]HLP63862.1 hypothetical protein [Flavobacterium sp.]